MRVSSCETRTVTKRTADLDFGTLMSSITEQVVDGSCDTSGDLVLVAEVLDFVQMQEDLVDGVVKKIRWLVPQGEKLHTFVLKPLSWTLASFGGGQVAINVTLHRTEPLTAERITIPLEPTTSCTLIVHAKAQRELKNSAGRFKVEALRLLKLLPSVEHAARHMRKIKDNEARKRRKEQQKK